MIGPTLVTIAVSSCQGCACHAVTAHESDAALHIHRCRHDDVKRMATAGGAYVATTRAVEVVAVPTWCPVMKGSK